MKRPSFQFYPGDWLRDAALRACSVQARGLWMDMLCFMHEGSPYGYLKVNQKIIQADSLAAMVGLPLKETRQYLEELLQAGVYSVDETGTIYSRRMLKDEHKRSVRAEAGSKGGNPNLLKQKDNYLLNLLLNPVDKPRDNPEKIQNPEHNITPSSSSSSFSKININMKIEDKSVFEQARVLYPGHKRGLDTEFEYFTKVHKDYPALLPLLLPAIQKQIQWRAAASLNPKGFVPPWQHFKTWLFNRSWELEVPALEMITPTSVNPIQNLSLEARLAKQNARS